MAEQRPHVERLLDLALFAPVGALVALRRDVPKHLRQGRQAVENRVQLARFIGEFAVRQGRKELAAQLAANRRVGHRDVDGDVGIDVEADADADVGGVSAPASDGCLGTDVSASISPDAVPETRTDVSDPVAPSSDELPIADYESLAAIHVVQRLGSLQPDELDAVRRFETVHRARRTILAKIAQLQGDV